MQKQNLKCTDARHLIHLAVGDDTLPEEEQLLGDHLHVCSDCRSYQADMARAMHTLERVRDEQSADRQTASLWPALAGKLEVRPLPLSPGIAVGKRRFNGSVVALCACSLMLAFVTLVQCLPLSDGAYDSSISTMPAMNVNFQYQQPASQRQSLRLVEVPGPNGTTLLLDPVTNQLYVPTLQSAAGQLPQPRELTF